MARRDLHFRITERQYAFLLCQSEAGGETMATYMRRLVHEAMKSTNTQNGTGSVPGALRDRPMKRYKSVR